MLPDKVNLTHDQIQDLKSSISDSNLNNKTKALITGLIDFNGWLQQQLLERQISIKRLKMIIFGEPQRKRQHKKIKSKTSRAKIHDNTASSNDENGGIKTEQDSAPSKTKSGRLSHQQYLSSEKVHVKHQQFKAGDFCPTECGGRLWNAIPGTVIKITGQGFAKATQYNLEKLRCSLCGHYLSATLPPSVSEQKYDYAFKAQLCLMKYFMGMP